QSAGFRDAARIRIDVRNARAGDDAKAVIGAALQEGVDAIVTIFGPSTQAARAATTRVPIVFCPVADPVAAKFVASSETPGGNLTGVASADAEASRRRLIALRQVLPELRRLAVLFDPDFPPDRVQGASLAVEHPVFELLVNLKGAGSLGLVVPGRAVEQAVRVIR